MTAPYSNRHIKIRQGDVLNDRRHGFGNENDVETEKNSFVVWAFGASTLFGFGVSDQLTIPAFLERHLASNFPDRKFKVVNFGQPYWYSSVEPATYLALLRSRKPPNAVVFLDGFNDVSWGLSSYAVPVFSARGKKAWGRKKLDAKRALPWFSINESFPLTRVLRALNYTAGAPIPLQTNPYESKHPTTSADVASTMIANYQMIRAMSETAGTKVFVFVQPTPWFGTYSADVDASVPFGNIVEAQAAYHSLIEASRKDLTGMLVDLTASLSDVDKPYVDNVHYSDAANELVALKMLETMASAF